MGEILEVLDRRWRNACRVVLKGEVSPLEDYLPYLSEYVEPLFTKKSSLSGKEVTVAFDDYSKNAKWLSFDETDYSRKFEPLSINQIKDIDSLVDAVSERICYSGSVILGNSGHVERSTNVSDSFYAMGIANMGDCKYLVLNAFGRLSEDCFGTYGPGESQFCIRCSQTFREKRCFEVWNSQNTSDCYYSYGLDACSECFFSFNLKNRKRCIGNLELDPSKYAQVKDKLLSEIVEKLKKDRRLPGILEIASKSRKADLKNLGQCADVEQYAGEDREIIEREFSTTANLILGRELFGMDGYRAWLERHTHPIEERESAASGAIIYTLRHMIGIPPVPPDRMLTIGEAEKLGISSMLSQIEAESISLENAHERIGRIAYFRVDIRTGANANLPECTACIDSSNCYRSSGTVYAKYCGYTFWPRSSQHCFGCDSVFDSSFCINCYRSQKLNRCFECDNCRDCSDSYFCHNCENVRDSMFCFNSKNLSHAIGNAPVEPGEYKSIKSMLLSQIADKLEKKKDLQLDIFNIV